MVAVGDQLHLKFENRGQVAGTFSWPASHVVTWSLGWCERPACTQNGVRSLTVPHFWLDDDRKQRFGVCLSDHGTLEHVEKQAKAKKPPCFVKPAIDETYWKCLGKSDVRTFVEVGPLLYEAAMWFPIYGVRTYSFDIPKLKHDFAAL